MFKIAAVCFLFVQAVYGEPHVINDCLNPGRSPTLLFNQDVSKTASLSHTEEETIRIPEDGFSPRTITCITVTNLDSDAEGGFPTIIAGGVGSNYVSIHLESQYGKGYHFHINVYYDNN